MQNPTNTVQPPADYTVTRVSFQQWRATAPDGTSLGTYQFQRYAANRCHRHARGLNW